MKILVSGLINIETNICINNFPVTYSPIEYAFNQINTDFSTEEISNMILINIRGIVFDWCKFQGQYDLVAQIRNSISIFVRGIK